MGPHPKTLGALGETPEYAFQNPNASDTGYVFGNSRYDQSSPEGY